MSTRNLRFGTRIRLVAVATLAVGVASLGAACGGDEESEAKPPPNKQAAQPKDAGKKAAASAAPKRGGGKEPEALQSYAKVEDRVPEAERATIRHPFRERDFMPDPTGSENRDPFRSYVVSMPGLIAEPGGPGEQTEQCSTKQLVATKYSLRDLRLVGIVARGTRRYALFQDSADRGNIVGRGDCLGKEKARVKDIGTGFVTLELTPDQVPGQAARAAEERSIPLYPEELPIGEQSEDTGTEQEGTVSPSTPPPSLPPPSLPAPTLPPAEQP